MPVRGERLFWLYVQRVGMDLASQIHAANQEFARQWTDSVLEMLACVEAVGLFDRLWLFRLKSKDARVAKRFNKCLKTHIEALPSVVATPSLRVKRQVNLPTPLVTPRLGQWAKTDIGLHVVNDPYNAMLVTYTYREGRFYNAPLLQLGSVEAITANIRNAWRSLACSCHTCISDCCGVGCYKCFQADCPGCDGTGWKDFSRWAAGGCQIDYSSGVPLAKY